MKYCFVEITEAFGEFESQAKFVVSCSDDQDQNDIVDRIAAGFRGDDDPSDGSWSYETSAGTTTEVTSVIDICEEEFAVLKKYLTDLTQ